MRVFWKKLWEMRLLGKAAIIGLLLSKVAKEAKGDTRVAKAATESIMWSWWSWQDWQPTMSGNCFATCTNREDMFLPILPTIYRCCYFHLLDVMYTPHYEQVNPNGNVSNASLV